jgi:predicted nucleotidyltransferase
MTPLERALRRIDNELKQQGQRFALIGGLAVSTRAEPRFTRDADLAVAVSDDAHAERIVRDLRASGYIADTLVEHERSGRLATVRLSHADGDGLITDLLFASSGIEPEIVGGADLLQITPTLVMPVASIGHLIATKLLARDDRRRPNDADDLGSLAAVATAADWDVAQAAVLLITQRGFNHDRDLLDSLATLRGVGPY